MMPTNMTKRHSMSTRLSWLRWWRGPAASGDRLARLRPASPGRLQPDRTASITSISRTARMIYSWGYGCNGCARGLCPAASQAQRVPAMQVPGPTLIVTEGRYGYRDSHQQPAGGAGNTSILFPGFQVTATGGGPWTC